ncbi:MAG: hypothetical protein H7Y13_05935 [Sphingobacteriaceae bacterium]|nr:hypothetical protein [Sphingobacteriaceae bacterium]
MKTELLKVQEIDYPSGSTLNFHKGKLYLMGDDACEVLILDTAFKAIGKIRLFNSEAGRIAKPIKPDIESSDIIDKKIWLLGSGTITPYRDSIFQINLSDKYISKTSLKVIYDKIAAKIEKLNIEGFAKINEQFILANRRNTSGVRNYFISLPADFLEKQQQSNVRIIPFVAPSPDAGISGLTFYSKRDILFVTCSEEFSKSTIEDGEIGQSYLGIISEASKKLDADSISTLNWLPLSVISQSFNNVKIESVAVSEIRKGLLDLYLTADNDNGKTILFKVRMFIK